MIEDNIQTYKVIKQTVLNGEEIDEDWATKNNWICIDHLCPNLYTLCLAHLCLSGAPEDDVNGHPFLSLAGVRFSTHLRKVLVAPTIPMEDQDSEEYCEVTALAVEMMRPSGCHNE